jgi:tetratricopeptide (TPR) repeat protein
MRCVIWWVVLIGVALSGCGRSQQQVQPQKSLLEQGIQKLEGRDYDGAAALFRQYVEQSRNLVVALQEVRYAYMARPERPAEQAYLFLEQYASRVDAIPNKIDRAGYYQVMGTLAFLAGRRDEYPAWFEKAIQLDPQNHLAMNDYAYALAEDGRALEKALRLARRAIAIKSNVGAYHDTHGWVLYKLGRYDEALRELRFAVQIAPDTPELRYHLAAVYAKLGRTEDALVELEKALALRPGHEPSLRLRKALLGKQGTR